MSHTFLLLQEKVLYKWVDTQFIYEGEENNTAMLQQARLAAQEITRNTGRTTRIIIRQEKQIEEITPAELRIQNIQAKQ